MKEKILNLRAEGKTYNQIVEILGCSKSTVCYYCGQGQLAKTKERNKAFYTKRGGLYKKLKGYCLDYGSKDCRRKRTNAKLLNFDLVQRKIGENPICYLTGEPIDTSDLASYSLDHINPISKGGDSSLENLGITTRKANQSKSDLTHKEFLELCKKVLIHHGYNVS